MDDEERRRRKIRQTIKVIIAEVCMVIAVILIVTVALLLSMGFSVNSRGDIEQTGIVQIHSLPTGATVEIDGNRTFQRTNLSKTLNNGEHDLKITKDGYDSWEKKIALRPGVLLRLYYPRLFPLNRKTESVKLLGDELEFYTTSADRTSILYAESDSTDWQLINVKGDDVRHSTLNMAEVLPGVHDNKFTGKITALKWSSASDYVLVKVLYEDKTDWIMVNVNDAKNSLNLTKTFGLDFTQIELVNGTAGQLYALEKQQLRKINTADQAISRVLLSDVESFAVNEANVIYVAKHKVRRDDTDQYEKIVGIYKDGEKGGTIIARADETAVVHAALSKYYGEYYMSFSVNDKVTVLYGNLPSYFPDEERELSLNELVHEAKINEVPEFIDVSADENEFVVMRRGKQFMVVDIEDGRIFEYQALSSALKWLDEAMLYTIDGNKLTVWDFDGTNRRTVLDYTKNDQNDTLANFDVVITHNNKWLYYIIKTSDGLLLMRDALL